MKLNEFAEMIKGKKVAVLGIGVSNTPLIKLLVQYGARVTACDRANEERLSGFLKELEGLPVTYQLGDGYLEGLDDQYMVFRTPVIRYDIPELVRAKEAGAIITSEMEVFFDLCPAKIIAVTGSDGKTTTTTLIYKILQEEGYRCWLGGNIGYPLLSRVSEMKEEDMVVLELSSFQLHTMRKSPDVAVITNISPNHLDVHKSMEEYVDAKKNIFLHQDGKGKVILNFDNEITRGLAQEANGKVVFFSRINRLSEGAVLEGEMLAYKDSAGYRSSAAIKPASRELAEGQPGKAVFVVKAGDILIPGVHNVENFLAAVAATIDFVKPQSIEKVAKTFQGVEHRNERVRELNGITFYNDAIASSPSRTTATLNAFEQEVILIAGGKDKKIPYDPLGEVLLRKVKKLVLVGETSGQIKKALEAEIKRTGSTKNIPVVECSDFREAVLKAYEGARPGDRIVLSPASTSFDMFRNFEEKGNRYKEIVNGL